MIEDSEDDAFLVIEYLRSVGHEPIYERVEDAPAMRLALDAMKAGELDKQWDIVLCDYMLPDFGPSPALQLLHESGLDLPFIVVSGKITADAAVEIMKSGCHDYVMKDDLPRLKHAIKRALADAKRRRGQKQLHNALLDSEQRFRAIADYTYDWESWLCPNSALRWVNPAVEHLSGYTVEDCYAMENYPLQIIHPDDRDVIAKKLELAAHGATENDVSFRIIRKDSGLVWMAGSWQSIKNDSGEALGYRTSFRDISQRKQDEDQLQLSARVFKQAHEGIMITDAAGTIVDVNPTFTEITGYSYEDAIGNNPRMFHSGRQSPKFYSAMWQTILEKGYWQGEVWNRNKNGELFAENLTISALKDEEDVTTHYVCLFSDITEIKQQRQQLELMAHYDMLTNLPNRVLFADRFTQIIAHTKRTKTQLAVCFLDLDNFKPVNDTYGHEVGDRLLVEVATRIKGTLREGDTASRQGGDEFALLLSDITSIIQCEKMLRRIHLALVQPFVIRGHTLKISASLGVTLYPIDDADLGTLLRHADQAMYQAKSAGKNQFHFFNAERDQQLKEKNYRLDEIQQALTNNELILYYQPKVNMRTGEVFGAEALIRWLHPEKGLIPPLNFLPLIDGTALEIQIGNWVINQGLQQLDDWHKQGMKLEVSVNISSHHLLSPTFIAEFDKALARYPAVQANCLQLEILESSALGDLQAISTIIKTCQDNYGVSIALDDFGTGYSSLTHLRNLSANTIKIDKSFVLNMLKDADDYAIINGVIGLANAFNRKVIAEGVETIEHGLMLLEMGCEQAQGYGIARPMPAENILTWLDDNKANDEWLACGNEVLASKSAANR
ncbi:MAG: diguanylate cyclase (GGDEF)-like protein/PAS domain S-box-containing protein [Gammaproteobacteria bacterium]